MEVQDENIEVEEEFIHFGNFRKFPYHLHLSAPCNP